MFIGNHRLVNDIVRFCIADGEDGQNVSGLFIRMASELNVR